nr:MAG TPA: hypothetical protein [Caudoviricetes sp.]
MSLSKIRQDTGAFLFTSFLLPLHTIPILEEFKHKKLCR